MSKMVLVSTALLYKLMVMVIRCIILFDTLVAGVLFGKYRGFYLTGSNFKTINGIGLHMCARDCENYDLCISANYWPSTFVCHLNNRNSREDTHLIVQNPDVIYIHFDKTGNGKCGEVSACPEFHTCIRSTHGSSRCILAECPVQQVRIKNDEEEKRTVVSIGQMIYFGCRSGYSQFGAHKGICRVDGTMAAVNHACYRVEWPWLLAFRGQSNVGYSDYYTYVSEGKRDELNTSIPEECEHFYKTTRCPYHYRTGLIDQWDTLQIQQVLFAIYKDGKEVHRILFDGKGSTFLDWFSSARIINSTWADVTRNQPFNSFSIQGFEMNMIYIRRFYINFFHSACQSDTGWFASSVYGVFNNCAYDLKESREPTYGVCLGNYACIRDSESSTADFIAVFVKSASYD